MKKYLRLTSRPHEYACGDLSRLIDGKLCRNWGRHATTKFSLQPYADATPRATYLSGASLVRRSSGHGEVGYESGRCNEVGVTVRRAQERGSGWGESRSDGDPGPRQGCFYRHPWGLRKDRSHRVERREWADCFLPCLGSLPSSTK